MSSSLLIDENPVLFQPSLALMLGVPGAIVTQQLHFLLNLPRSGRTHKGEKWIYNTYEEWQRDHFPFWSLKTIQRTFRFLEQIHVVEHDQMEGRHSRRKYYRLNRGMVAKLIAANCPKNAPEEDTLSASPEEDILTSSGKTPKCPDGRGQSDVFLIAETSPETPKAETSPRGGRANAQKKKTQSVSTIGHPNESVPRATTADDRRAPRAAKVPPAGLDEFREFAISQDLDPNDGDFFFHKLQSTGWTMGGKAVKDWRSCILSWKAAKYLPSQKPRSNGHATTERAGPAKMIL